MCLAGRDFRGLREDTRTEHQPLHPICHRSPPHQGPWWDYWPSLRACSQHSLTLVYDILTTSLLCPLVLVLPSPLGGPSPPASPTTSRPAFKCTPCLKRLARRRSKRRSSSSWLPEWVTSRASSSLSCLIQQKHWICQWIKSDLLAEQIVAPKYCTLSFFVLWYTRNVNLQKHIFMYIFTLQQMEPKKRKGKSSLYSHIFLLPNSSSISIEWNSNIRVKVHLTSL